MRRLIKRAIVFLLLGAVFNVAVAWSCAAWVRYEDDSSSGGLFITDSHNWAVFQKSGIGWLQIDSIRYGIHVSWRPGPLNADPNNLIPEWCDFDTPTSAYLTNDVDREDRVADAFGWPYLSLFTTVDFGPNWRTVNSDIRIKYGIRLHKSLPVDSTESLRILPLRPIWSGFLLNTVFYGSVVWIVLISVRASRRSMRLKRGLCPACAYPIGMSRVCTECGCELPFVSDQTK